jgi:dTDP-glucose pyrophosphorylase/predicted transcriptional regulator
MKPKKFINHLIFTKDKIKIAVKKLDKLDNKFCLVLGNDNKLLGTITDGDIRRGLLKNYTMNDEVRKIYNKKPVVVKKVLSIKQIDSVLKKKDITFIPLINENRKIIQIYDSKNKNKAKLIDNHMLIMAGGKGLRLRPLTNKIPKPLLLVNKRPIIEHIIIAAKNEGITHFYISINYLGYKIKKYLGDGSNLGVKIKYLEEKKPLGTAGSISLIKKFNNPIFVTNADILSRIDLKEMIKYHQKNKSHITIAAKVAYEKDNYGRILARGSVVKKVIEKLEKNLLINAGIYIIDPKVKKFIKKSEYLDMTDLINLALSKNTKINVFPIHEKWLDYGLKKNLKK